MLLQKWQKHYPEISFSLSFFPFEKKKLFSNKEDLEYYFSSSFPLETEIFYIVGLLGFPLPSSIWQWLEEKKERVLYFLETDLGAFAEEIEERLISHPQVHFRYLKEELKEEIERLAREFPSDKIAVYLSSSLFFDALALERRSATYSALYSDILYSHTIVDNVYHNYERFSSSVPSFDANQWNGAFKGIPAIICGAGPSLDKVAPLLQNFSQSALIIAGGSAITALSKYGVRPHLSMALDPNEEEFDRLKQSHLFEGPFLFSPRLQKKVFSAMNGPYGYLSSGTGGWMEEHLEKLYFGKNIPPTGPDLGDEAFSVTTLAVSYAYTLGCSCLIFVGMDLAYTGGKRYSQEVEGGEGRSSCGRALEKPLIRKDIYGNPVETLLKWVMESETISQFANNHPEVPCFNATEGGLGFEGMTNLSLSSVFQHLLPSSIDLYGKIHSLIATTSLCASMYSEEKIAEGKKTLFASLLRSYHYAQDMTKEERKEGEKAWIELEYKEEVAYHCLFEGIDKALDHLLPRYFPSKDPIEMQKNCTKAKWRELERQAALFLSLFDLKGKKP